MIYRRVQPDLIQHFTVKAVLYGTTAAWVLRFRAVANSVTGLPFIIVSDKRSWQGRFARWVAMKWYGWSVTDPRSHPIVQNQDDLETLASFAPSILDNHTMTRGSGVDLERFQYSPPPENDVPIVLFVGRLLKEKGIFELMDAVRDLRNRGLCFRFHVCGDIDLGNRSSATTADLQSWIHEGIIDQQARVDDVRMPLRQADLVVLPSWREGTPRSLLEAMAIGRPIIATDVPGCREVIEDGMNGYLVPPHDSPQLANAIECLLMNAKARQCMGGESRLMAESRFDEREVIENYLLVYRQLLGYPDCRPPKSLKAQSAIPNIPTKQSSDELVSQAPNADS